MATQIIARGRPIDIDVQKSRLELEALEIRLLQEKLDTVNLGSSFGIDRAARLVVRMGKHLGRMMKARVLITENS